jgi:hypothetical protein
MAPVPYQRPGALPAPERFVLGVRRVDDELVRLWDAPVNTPALLWGVKLGVIAVSATAHRCVVCLDLARPTFVGR